MNKALHGYARVSTKNQEENHSLRTQCDALTNFGVPPENIVCEVKSAFIDTERELDRLLERMNPGDRLVATRMDRLFRNLKTGLDFFERAEEKGLEIILLDMPFLSDRSAPGKMVRTMLMSFAEMETELRRERIREAIDKARAGDNDPFLNRKTRTKDSVSLRNKIQRLEEAGLSVSDNAKACGISRTTYYKIRQKIRNNLPLER